MGDAIAVQARTDTPRIYVACLAAYNQGMLHGAWVEAAQEPWALWDAVQAMLAASPVAEEAEEWGIHDYEGFGALRLSEYAGVEAVAGLARFIAGHGAIGLALLDHYDGDVEQAGVAMEDRHLGTYASLADYVQEVMEEAQPVPAALAPYIDREAMARDAELSGDLFAIRIEWDTVHVFAGY